MAEVKDRHNRMAAKTLFFLNSNSLFRGLSDYAMGGDIILQKNQRIIDAVAAKCFRTPRVFPLKPVVGKSCKN